MGAREFGDQTPIGIGDRRRRGQEHTADGGRGLCLAPRLEHGVEWSHDRLQLGRIPRSGNRAVPARPGNHRRVCADGEDGSAALQGDAGRDGIPEPIKHRFPRQRRRRGATLGEPASLRDRLAQRHLEGARSRSDEPLAEGRPAALDPPHAHGTAREDHAEQQAHTRRDQTHHRSRSGRSDGERHAHETRKGGEHRPDGDVAAQPLGRREAGKAARDYDVSLPLHLSVLTPDAVRAALARDSRLLVPVGTCEQHGPHLPLGCDTLIVERLADDLSSGFGLLRAPTIAYGVNTATKRPYPGNAAVRRKTLHRWMNDLLGAWEQCGVDAFIILTAHGHDPHQEALSTLRTRRARVFTVDIFALDFTGYLENPGGPTHGGELDTSLMLHLAPELVRMDLAQDYPLTERQVERYRRGAAGSVPALSPGSVGRPSLASAEKGARLYKMIRDRIATRVLGAVAA